MNLLNDILKYFLKKRISDIQKFIDAPHETQSGIFQSLVEKGKKTEWGLKYGYGSIRTYDDFKSRVPVSSYEELFPYIQRMLNGEQNILWPDTIKWFSKSSGTTNAKSKFIPVSTDALEECHYKGGKDLLSLYFNNRPDSKLFTGKGLAIGGTYSKNPGFDNSFYGDVSAVIMANLPLWAQYARTPSLEIALMDEWEQKIEKIAQATIKENVTNISGVPTWTIVLLERILAITGKKNLMEVWPEFEAFFHGAVAFTPYKEIFKKFFPDEKVKYIETYNASEGFFGMQDRLGSDEMLLMLDYGIFYEFIPMEDFESDNPKTLSLSEVELNKNYAMVISTNAGLWRYKIGDTVKFTSLSPYRIKISGRTKHFINVFGEEVIVENAETAISLAGQQTGAIITNFTAAPVYFSTGNKGGHEWIVEFSVAPTDMELFTKTLDEELKKVNSDYEAKRYKDLALQPPIVHKVPEGTFYRWMKKRGKLGGQNKVPRLSNSREYVDDILKNLIVLGDN
ncbi:MAG TPA: GH3 auxin-responsive promoter family protein [Cytophagaceae bacterium]